MSRQFKAYASAYGRRDHESSLMQGEVQQYACDFNGALNAGESITAATWASDHACVTLSGLGVDSGIATVTVTAVNPGCAVLTLQVTTSEGRKLDQRFAVGVQWAESASQSVSWTP